MKELTIVVVIFASILAVFGRPLARAVRGPPVYAICTESGVQVYKSGSGRTYISESGAVHSYGTRSEVYRPRQGAVCNLYAEADK